MQSDNAGLKVMLKLKNKAQCNIFFFNFPEKNIFK